MSYTAEGKVVHIGDRRDISDKFSVRDLVIEVDGKYPQIVKFQFVNDRIDLIEKVGLQDMVSISFDLRGREHDGKYYTNLNGWKIDIIEGAKTPSDADPF